MRVDKTFPEILERCKNAAFWDTPLASIDFHVHRDFVIERLLQYGGMEGVHWLLHNIPHADVVFPFGKLDGEFAADNLDGMGFLGTMVGREIDLEFGKCSIGGFNLSGEDPGRPGIQVDRSFVLETCGPDIESYVHHIAAANIERYRAEFDIKERNAILSQTGEIVLSHLAAFLPDGFW